MRYRISTSWGVSSKVPGCDDQLRQLDACGLVDPLAVMHSLRKSGIIKLHVAGPENLAVILAGHESKRVHGRLYVDRRSLPLSLLREGLEKLRYDEVVEALKFPML
jgi:hypothetical protein